MSAKLEAAIAARMARGVGIPEPSPGRNQAVLSAQTSVKVRLYQWAHRKGITKGELAHRLNWHNAEVDKLFDLNYASRIDHIEAACHAIGLRLTFNLQEHG